MIRGKWTPPEPQRKVVRELMTFLEDRRALYNDYAFDIEHEVVQSVFEIRREVNEALKGRACAACPRSCPWWQR